ncbi:MAG: NYN domain-containing protein [Armatimonadetes bacterium]|nr:NYN domain-containing protein [Armatimonadota bacterium]NOG93181.1 NYN domain-containing protein [Armatimonadota bacterium]
MATAVYVDGFNLYYGLARPLDCKWVDLQAFFELQFSRDDVRVINFYEALVAGPARHNQQAYISALESRPKIRIVLGEMKQKPKICRVASCTHLGERKYLDYEEKHTDVSIAISMVDDTHSGAFERLVLVTADTDLEPAVRLVRQIRPEQDVVLCMPALDRRRIFAAKNMAILAGRFIRTDAELFLKCQMPSVFTDSSGRSHVRPGAWREAPLSAAKDWKARNPDRWLAKMPNWK